MAATRIAADFTWGESTPDGTTVEIDITNEDSLLVAIEGGNPGFYLRYEGSVDGEFWTDCSLLDGGNGWDAYNSYYTQGGQNILLALPTFACAPLKWFRARKVHVGDESGGQQAHVMISTGIIGR